MNARKMGERTLCTVNAVFKRIERFSSLADVNLFRYFLSGFCNLRESFINSTLCMY